jgi:predicted metal-binding protein
MVAMLMKSAIEREEQVHMLIFSLMALLEPPCRYAGFSYRHNRMAAAIISLLAIFILSCTIITRPRCRR